jgi:hypothetical protein
MGPAYLGSFVIDSAQVFFRKVNAFALNQDIPATISYVELDGIEMQIPLQGFHVITVFGAGHSERQIPAARRLAFLADLIFLFFCLGNRCWLH